MTINLSPEDLRILSTISALQDQADAHRDGYAEACADITGAILERIALPSDQPRSWKVNFVDGTIESPDS